MTTAIPAIISRRVDSAVSALTCGHGVVLYDTGPIAQAVLLFAASLVTLKEIERLQSDGDGRLQLALTELKAKALSLTAPDDKRPFSIGASGESSGNRAERCLYSLRKIISPCTSSEEIQSPGPLSPVVSHPDGIGLQRGLTEGAIELVTLAGLNHSALFTRLKPSRGKLTAFNQAIDYAQKNQWLMLTVDDVYQYAISAPLASVKAGAFVTGNLVLPQ